MTHPIDRYLPRVHQVAHLHGLSLLRQDREELEASMRLTLWQAWQQYDPAKGKRDTWLIGCLNRAAMEWMRSRAPRRISRSAHVTLQETPPGSPGWEALPEYRRQWILGQVALASPASLDEMQADLEDEDPSAVTEPADPGPGPEASCIARAEIVCLFRLVGMLPPRQRECLLLYHVEGLTQLEIAARLGVSNKCVSTSIYNGLERVRRALGVNCRGGTHERVVSAADGLGIPLSRPVSSAEMAAIAARAGIAAKTARGIISNERWVRRLEG